MTKVNFHQKAVILNGENKFLVLKATYKNKLWDLPGGAVEIPELHTDALIREIGEETGLEVIDMEPVVLETAFDRDTEEYIIFAGFQCRVRGYDVILSGEHSEHKWVSMDEFLNLDTTPYLNDFVEKWSSKSLTPNT